MSDLSREQLKKMAAQGRREQDNIAIKVALDKAGTRLDEAECLARGGITQTCIYDFYGPLKYAFFGGPRQCLDSDIANMVIKLAKTRGFDAWLETYETNYTYKHEVIASWA